MFGLGPIRDLRPNPNLEYFEGDCRNIQDVVKALRGASSVIHLAAVAGDTAYDIDETAAVEINYAATRMLIEAARGYGVERFLFASSCSVYGKAEPAMDENTPVEPVSLYARTKAESERALMEAAGPNFHPVIMRFATVFGLSNRPRFDLVVNLLAAKAQQEGVIRVFNGEQRRAFLHVKDLVEAILLLLDAPEHKVSGQVFNVGDNRLNHTLNEVAETVRRVFPGTRVEHGQSTDSRDCRVSFDKIEKLTGFRAKHSLEDGVRQIKEAFDQGLILTFDDQRFAANGSERGARAAKAELDKKLMAAFAE
jgi:nucleoside-diphosphate-sugar epimerase